MATPNLDLGYSNSVETLVESDDEVCGLILDNLGVEFRLHHVLFELSCVPDSIC